MRKSLALAVSSIMLLSSCVSVNPFTHDDPYIASASMKRGTYVFTTTEDVAGMLDVALPSSVEVSRVSGGIDYKNGCFYGAVEGTFSKASVDAVLMLSPDFERVSGKKAYYRSSGVELMTVANGIVLFASSGIEEVYEKTYLNRIKTMPDNVVSSLMSSEAGFYVSNPDVLPDIGFDFKEESVERFDYILATASDGKFDVCFGMKNENFANSLLKLIRAAVVTQIKASGKKPDISELKKTITEEGSLVFLKNCVYEKPFFGSMMEFN